MPSQVGGFSEVIGNLRRFEHRVDNNLESEMDRLALDMEVDAKRGAPWTDRTGNARRSITGTSARQGDFLRSALAIGMFYGKYLELSNGGRFRIVRPTIDGHRRRFVQAIRRAFK